MFEIFVQKGNKQIKNKEPLISSLFSVLFSRYLHITMM